METSLTTIPESAPFGTVADTSDGRRDQLRALASLLDATTTQINIWRGQVLLAEKAERPHGDWLPWLDSAGLDPQQAQRCMRVAKAANTSSVTHFQTLSWTEALREARRVLSPPRAAEAQAPTSGAGHGELAAALTTFHDAMLAKGLTDSEGWALAAAIADGVVESVTDPTAPQTFDEWWPTAVAAWGTLAAGDE